MEKLSSDQFVICGQTDEGFICNSELDHADDHVAWTQLPPGWKLVAVHRWKNNG